MQTLLRSRPLRAQMMSGPPRATIARRERFDFRRRRKSWAFEEMREVNPRTYSPLGEFGEWGIRRGTSGAADTMGGNSGVELLLADHTRVLIGTWDAAAFARAIDHAQLGAPG